MSTSKPNDEVRLCNDWLEALERERERNGEMQTGRMQRKQHEWQREAFRQHLEEKFTEVK